MQCRYYDELRFHQRHIEDIQVLEETLRNNPDHASLLERGRNAIADADAAEVANILSLGLARFGAVHPLLAIKCWYEEIGASYCRQNISEDTRIATLLDIRLWMESYEKTHQGQTGLEQVYWISRHLCAKILRLGRLQYEPKIFGQSVCIYRDKHSGNLLTLAEGNHGCTAQGHLSLDKIASFVTAWHEDDSTITAFPVDTTNACILSKPTTFAKADLQRVADRQTEVVFIHIPEDGKLDTQAVDESLSLAGNQFPHHTLFFCVSWLLDPALLRVASKDSNIVSFMQRFEKFPVPFQQAQIFERVFGKGLSEEECMRLHPHTSLQENIQRELKKGCAFRTIGGFTSPS